MTTKIDGEHHGAHDTGFVGCTEKVRVAFLVNSHGNMYMHLHGCYVYAPACMLQACMQWGQLECLHTSHMHPCVCACRQHTWRQHTWRQHTCIHAYVPAYNIHAYMHTCIGAYSRYHCKRTLSNQFFLHCSCAWHTLRSASTHTHKHVPIHLYTQEAHTHYADQARTHTHVHIHTHTHEAHTHANYD